MPRLIALILLITVVPTLWVSGQVRSPQQRPRRAALPTFEDASSIFFDNAFEKLKGERPTGSSTISQRPATTAQGAPGEQPGGEPAAIAGWSKIIAATTIEDEIKALKRKVDEDVDKPQQFAGRGYLRARTHFTELAMLFAIINEYDGDVRWKREAAAARDAFARAAANCKVGTTQAFNDATRRKQQLDDLIRGSGLDETVKDAKNDWEAICDRGPLMKRLETAQQGILQPFTASDEEFAQNAEQVLHEAEVLAAISEVLFKPGMEDGDDEDYANYAVRMKKAAGEIVTAVKLKNSDAARKAVGEIGKACSECHENYRA